ncbi:MAG TPA: ABC-2 family transporter protein [Roseiflexaceae bacterium]|nr:ABC-2 family transporter protein [Roseiflexaceae bacterium]
MEADAKDQGRRTKDEGTSALDADLWSLVFGLWSKVGRGIYLNIRRILRLWKMYAALDFTLLMSNMKLALIWYISDGIVNLASVTATLLLAERFAGIGAWNRHQVVFLLGYATVVSGLMNMFFGYNVLTISRRLGRGQLDHTLVQPQPIWLSLLTEGFMPFSGSSVLLPGIGLLTWAGGKLALVMSPEWLALLILNLAASSAIVLAFSFLWGSLAFWAPLAAEEISSSSVNLLSQLKPFPLDGLGPLLRSGLLTVVPVGFVAWYPCWALLGLDPSGWSAWVTPLMAVIFALVTSWLFRKGLRYYGRTGSQRYSSLGHRG